MAIQYFSIDQTENTKGEHLHSATSSEVNMVSPQQTKTLHLQLRPLPSLPNMLAPPLPAPRLQNMLAPPLPAPRLPNMLAPPLPAPRLPNMLAPPLPAPRLPNMLAPPLPAPRLLNMITPALPAPRDPSCDSKPPPLPHPRKKPLIQMEANVTPSSIIQERFIADSPMTFSRKNQAVFVAVLLCVVVITVPTLHTSFFSGGSEVSSHGLLFVHIN